MGSSEARATQEWVGPGQAAKLMGVSRSSVLRLVDTGTLSSRRRMTLTGREGWAREISRASIDEFMRDRQPASG